MKELTENTFNSNTPIIWLKYYKPECVNLVMTAPPDFTMTGAEAYYDDTSYNWKSFHEYMTDMEIVFTQAYIMLKNYHYCAVIVGDQTTLVGEHYLHDRKFPLAAYFTVKLTKLKAEHNKCRTQYDKLNEEIANTLIGESFYSPEQLSMAMTKVQQNIAAIESQIEKTEEELNNKKNAMMKIKPMYEQFKGWAEEFDLVPIEQKKMIISQLISRIEIGKGYSINIQLNMDYEQFCEGWMGK